MASAEISKSQDLAAAIALPPASNIIFLPFNIISLFFMRKKAGGVYRPNPFLSLKQVFEALSGCWPCHACKYEDCDADDLCVRTDGIAEATNGTHEVEHQQNE
jgi:hypothetical protein